MNGLTLSYVDMLALMVLALIVVWLRRSAPPRVLARAIKTRAGAVVGYWTTR